MKKPDTTEREFIEHLKSEIAYLRGDNAFLKGKCERLELAVLQPKGIERFTEPAPIESVKVEAQPKASNWLKAQQDWNSLSEEEQVKRLGGTLSEGHKAGLRSLRLGQQAGNEKLVGGGTQ